uniref:Tyrosine-protein kinase n=1 Tax=Panagrellus redivivus TaxID=6233 RepID=A0A7E4ZVM7_PANRE
MSSTLHSLKDLTDSSRCVGKRVGKSAVPSPQMVSPGIMAAMERSILNDVTDESKKLHKLGYYHGLRPRADCEALLKNVGDFLLRSRVMIDHTTKRRTFELIISVYSGVRREHLSLYYDKKTMHWDLNIYRRKRHKHSIVEGRASRFLHLSDMIAYYQANPILNSVKLTNPIRRPDWIITAGCLKYDDQKDELGRGNFAVVIKGYIERRDKPPLQVAVKKLPEERIDDERTERENACNALFKEAHLMNKFHHPNVITFYGVCCDLPPVMVVTELCAGGSLESHLVKTGDAISNGERLLFITEAARGMNYLQRKNCIHRDLASRNCLIAANGVVKISDFGLSKMVEATAKITDDTVPKNLPLRWMAPETINRQPKFSSKSDVWGFCVMIYEVFNNGIKPWNSDDDYRKIGHAIRNGKMPEPPKRTPAEMLDLMKSCWQMDPEKRPNFCDILKEVREMSKKNPKLAYPVAKECTTSKIPGVIRIEPKEEELEKSLMEQPPINTLSSDDLKRSSSVTNTNTTTTTTTTTSEDLEHKCTPKNKNKRSRH